MKSEFKNAFETNDIMLLSEKILNQHILEDSSQEQIDQLAADLTSIILEPAKQGGMCKKIGTKGRKPRKNPRQPWFNEDCEKK